MSVPGALLPPVSPRAEPQPAAPCCASIDTAEAPQADSSNACSMAGTKPSQSTDTKNNEPPCAHNSWDNVRVIKGQVTLRCRVCQVQWRTHVDAVWRKKKCGFFNTPEGCSQGSACPKLHLHPKKQSLSERIKQHGEAVLTLVPANAHPSSGGDSSSSSCRHSRDDSPSPDASGAEETSFQQHTKVLPQRRCTHNSWDNVRVKKGLVTLRCRVCQSQWRRPLADLPKCPGFPNNCKEGDQCTKLHLHASKQSLAARIGTHGPAVLERVPAYVLKVNRLACENSTTTSGSLGSAHDDDMESLPPLSEESLTEEELSMLHF